MKNGILILAAFLSVTLLRRYLGSWALLIALVCLVLLFLRKKISRTLPEESDRQVAPGLEEAPESTLLGESLEEAVVLPIEDSLDLHPFAPSEIPDAVSNYLDLAARAGFREVRIIHGKGIGFQRERVQKVLRQHPCVEWFRDAPPERGGWGATIAGLRASNL